MENKIYCGSGKEIKFQNGGSLVKLSLCLSDIPDEFVKLSEKNGKKYVTLKLTSRKSIDNYGNTHSVEVDTWKPDSTQATASKTPAEMVQAVFGAKPSDDIPF
jgi:uncharacterized membrane protein